MRRDSVLSAGLGLAGLLAGAAALGWGVAGVLGALSPLSPVPAALAAAAAAAVWVMAARPLLGGTAALWPWWLGLAGLALPVLAARLGPRLAGFSFERVGWLWLPGGWVRADPATYLVLLVAGALMGLACFLVLWSVRRDARAVWAAGLATLALAAVWRTVVHPLSGDEPSLLFAAWHWQFTGSADLTWAWGGAAEWLSRAGDFRDSLIRDHTVGPLTGPRYTYHGVILPHLYGLLLWPAGRFGLALALVGIAAGTVALMTKTAEAVLGKPVPAGWLAAVLVGSPLAVYTVFMGPDLPAAAVFAAGAFGLARRRPLVVALAAAALPWIHQKCLFPAAGLALAAWWISPRAGLGAGAALLASFVPEAVWISGKIGLPIWPPSALFERHATYGAAYSLAYWGQSVPGLLVDRYAGLIWAPAFVLGLAGLAWWRTRRSAAVSILAAAVPYLVLLLTFNMWTGGNGAPSRQLVVILPGLALGVLAVDLRLRAGAWRRVWDAALWAGIAHAHVLLFVPPVAFESAKLKLEAVAMNRLGIDPLTLLPAISKLDSGAWPGWLAVAWMAVLVFCWVALFRSLRGFHPGASGRG
ncbi:MAG: hypothetical protein AAB152_05955 [Candidatus Coatesbacteria bacterium]